MLVIMQTGEICIVPGTYRRLCPHNAQKCVYHDGEYFQECGTCKTPVSYHLVCDEYGMVLDMQDILTVDYQKAKVTIQAPRVSEIE